MIDEQKFKEQMAVLGEIYNKEISPALAETFWNVLSDCSDEDFAKAADLYMRSPATFFPTPGQLLELMAGTAKERAHAAWGEVLIQIQNIRTARFDDPATARAVQMLGGAEMLGHTSYEQLEFKKHQFVEAYESMADREFPIGIEDKGMAALVNGLVEKVTFDDE
ncbi:hypothetical protein LCGC14_1704240 [marine sediment metagenome]|uniref:DUF6475 domain-containing protein n=1 Tax=marine sediment metagenome TaxID=412755 RepID=A0A0F9HGR3_9ZZZZ